MTRALAVAGRLGAVALLSLPLAAGAVITAASPAAAAVTAPGNGAVFETYGTVPIRADYGASSNATTLTLTSPGGPAVEIDRAEPNVANGGTLSYDLDTGCWTFPSSSCRDGRLAPNGTWTVTQSGGTSGSTTFVTRIRPKAPTGLTATPMSRTEVKVSWRLGAEPDLTGWTLFEGSGVVNAVTRSACEAGTCSAVVRYATEGSGEHTYTVRASRSVAPGSSETLEGPQSAPVTTRLDAPAAPASPAPGTGGGTAPGSGGGTGGTDDGGSGAGTDGGSGNNGGTGGGSTGGGTSGGGTGGGGSTAGGPTGGGPPISTGTAPAASADQQAVAQRKAFALSFSAFGPKLGIPKLPPLPQAQAPAVAPEVADGTFEPTLGFEDQVVRERVEVAQGPTQRVRNVVGTALDSERLLRSTAAALVLLLAGAHLRRWLSAGREEP